MDIKKRNQIVYKKARKYLDEIKPDQITSYELQKYFVGNRKDFSTLEDVFEQIIHSAQNHQKMTNVIKYQERREHIKSILNDFDLKRISQYDVEELYYRFRDEFSVNSADNNLNSWHKWSKSIVDASKFMTDFEDINDFKRFATQFDYNLLTRIALPLLISKKISGMGFALACDFLKELGYTNYSKPDVHIIEVFVAARLSSNDPISVFEAIAKMAEDCKNIDPEITPYKIDKVIWLICTGKFYLDGIPKGSHKKEFISQIQNEQDEENEEKNDD
jgi:thermostable 8-oxoguanine DNA glycosylase